MAEEKAPRKGRNERSALAFLRSAGLRVEDDPRAAALLSAGVALDVKWDAATSRELRQLRRELAEYVAARRPVPEPEGPSGEPAAVTSIVDRLRRPAR